MNFNKGTKALLTILLLLTCKYSFSQQIYGNEWIKPNLTYYTLKTIQNGIYKIDYNQLASKLNNVASINPKFIKVFKNGVEQAIYISGEADLKLDPSDYILLYGAQNDGNLDTQLYENPNFQSNPYSSLYTDTSVYFLTVDVTDGKRLALINESNIGLTPQSSVKVSTINSFNNVYYGGAYVLAETSESEYREGEGLAASVIGKNQNLIQNLNTKNHINGTPFTFSYGVIGRSNASFSNSLGHNHHFRIELTNNSSNYNIVADSSFRSYSFIKKSKPVSSINLGNVTALKISVIDDLNALTDFLAPSFYRIDYQRNLDIQGVNSLEFYGSYNSKSLLKFSNNSIVNPFLIDFNNSNIITGVKNGSDLEFVIKAAQNNNYYLFDQSNVYTANIEVAKFTGIKTNIPNDFVIITNKALSNGANDYKIYRTQSGYNPVVVTTEEIFNEFFYGVNHPLGVRNFVQYLQNYSSSVKYILLLGKGISNKEIITSEGKNQNLVPTIGYPPSDNMFSAPLYGSNLAPTLAISRVPALTNQQVKDYLNKLKEYESKADNINRKEIIHISGGSNLNDNLSWAAYQQGFGSFAIQPSLGAKLIAFKKNVSLPITNNLQEKIIAEINKGTHFLSFLGHGSAFATEINFGSPNELATNSLLTYMINGCLAGNPNTLNRSIGENYLFEPNKGAIGWIATSDEGVASYLSSFSRFFYKNSYQDNYGKSVAQNLAIATQQFQNPSDILNRMHTRQYNLQGDPAYKFYSPSKPDFYLEQNSIFIQNPKTTTSSDSLTIGVIIKNSGKALPDSLNISLKRTFKDNSVIDYGIKKVKPLFNTDTIYYTLPMISEKAQGNNTFTITVDPSQLFSESNEFNNTNSSLLYIPGNGVNLIYPKQLSIINSQQVEFIVQSSDLFTQNKTYLFEIDTVKTFDSNWKKTISINSNALAKTTISILPDNNKNYYWRSKLDLATNDGGDWQYSSFTYLNNFTEGFSQKGDQDAFNNNYKTIIYNIGNNKFEFEKTTHLITLSTRGDDASTADERTFRSSRVGRLAFAGYEFESFTIVTLNPTTGDFYSFPSVNNFQNYPPIYTGQYFFRLNNETDVDSLINYINKIPNGYFVVGLNGRNVDLKGMPQRAKDAFAKIGCLKINDVNAGEPYLFFGQKGIAPGLAIEMTADYTSAIPPRSQYIIQSKEYNPFFNTGYYMSEKIGPAKSWTKAYFNFLKEPSDILSYDIIGINNNGIESTLLSNLNQDSVSLSGVINANLYPFLKIKATATDNTNRTPSQLKNWRVAYEDISESTINLDLANIFHSNQIQEGDSVSWKIGYQNISKHISDTIKVYSVITTPQRSETKTLISTINKLQPNENTIINLKTKTLGLNGQNSLRLEFESKTNKDSYSFNNQIRKDFNVIGDKKEPIIDLTFDGKHIINREIVSPTPHINISIKDENLFLLLNDTSVLEVSIKKEDDITYKRVYYKNGKLTFNPATSNAENNATISYKPDKLDDGIYVLKLRSKDKSGNYNASSDLEISFEVINKSTITSFYPYPNPVVNSMKFVFTLTGETIPDKIKIQISSMSGKVVREILKEELGDLKIGNNVSQFTWDGTDQFGDRLANGVYFYKVFIESNNTSVQHRNTSGDKYFKNQTGKIYLLK